MEPPPNHLDRLEKKVDFLTWVVSVQAVLIGIVAASYLFQFASRLFIIALVALPVLFVFRSSLPGLARQLGRLIGKAERYFRSKVTDSHSSTLP